MKFFCFLVFFIAFQSLHAQLFDKNDQASNQSSSSSTAINQQQTIKSVIQDGPVDPKEYIVGPGDVFG
ncbi:MAG: hypothetical protein PHP42_12665, partial [Bacteroidota bacterium]|nr:hypothetical protein [Bacteroidota bacterium]